MRGVSADRLLTPGGQLFDLPPDLDDYNRCALFAGRYERLELKLLKRYFETDSTIIEIGANIGVVARYAFLNRLRDGGTYICVEPNPHSRAALHANMLRAQTKRPWRKFDIVAAAVAAPARDGQKERFALRQNLGSALATTNTSEEGTVEVDVHSLSSLMRDLAPAGASLICDAEGGEIPMILEDTAGFAAIRQILIELHEPWLTGRSETPDQMIAALEKLGFTVLCELGNCCYLRRTK
jgi:FkbM family methyltransferase